MSDLVFGTTSKMRFKKICGSVQVSDGGVEQNQTDILIALEQFDRPVRREHP